jgi:hypothetical protein
VLLVYVENNLSLIEVVVLSLLSVSVRVRDMSSCFNFFNKC